MAHSLTVPRRGATAPIRRSWLPGGDAGVYATMLAMRTVVRAAFRHPLVQHVAMSATADAPDVLAQWRGLRAWLVTNTRFRLDAADPVARANPDLLEVVHTPLDQLAAIARDAIVEGDCDDVAVLAATLAMAVGLRARFVVLGWLSPGPSASYRHIFTEVAAPGGWLDFDVTRNPSSPLPTRRATLEV